MKKAKSSPQYVVCIQNKDCEDLTLHKIYEVLPDARARVDGYLRVTDESGEDYLYPTDYFIPIRLSQPVEKALALAS